MSRDRYRTLVSDGEGIIRERSSKFIGIAFPIADEDGFKEKLQQIISAHPTTRHQCYAWVLGPDGDQFRTNDAGEPNGTAGKPIHRRIQALDLSYCAVVVVRYFGGTLLGKAGLVHAYGDAAQLALSNATIDECFVMERFTATCDYDRVDLLKADVQLHEGVIVSSDFAMRCAFVIDLPLGRYSALAERWDQLGISSTPQ